MFRLLKAVYLSVGYKATTRERRTKNWACSFFKTLYLSPTKPQGHQKNWSRSGTMPAGNTLAEFCGHLVFSFTRSVAEHYNHDEPENHSALFGYNAFDDTGKEWYCQPVDEVIYQEYSNSEATAIDYLTTSSLNTRLIDACSTEEVNDETQEPREDSEMAWKQLRPSFFNTVWNSLYFGFLISVSSAAIVGIISILVYYLSYQTLLSCKTVRSKESIPNKLQWVITISEIVVVLFFYYWFFLNILFYFRPFQISGQKLKLALISLTFYCFDAGYRICMQALGISRSDLTYTQRIPLICLFFLCSFTQLCVIVGHFCSGPGKSQLKLFTLTTVPCMLTYFTSVMLAYFVYPAYNKQDRNGKMIISIFTPLITVVVKGVSRICVQRLSRLSHPGTSFVPLVPLYCGSAVMLRLLQVDIQSLKAVALIGVIHGIAEVIERSTMVLIDHLYNRVLEKRTIPWGGFRTPHRERLAADICIMSMLYESSAIISVNGFLYLYQYFYTSDNSPLELVQSFASTTSVPLVIEWFFTSVSIAIETRYQNMPVMAVWRRRWRRHILVALLNAMVITIWTCTYLFVTAKGRYCTDLCLAHCEMPFSRP